MKCFQLFTVEYVSCRFVIGVLSCVEICFLYVHFLEGFYHKFYQNLLIYIFKTFFILLTWNLIGSIENFLHPSLGESHLVMLYDVFNVWLDFDD